VSAFFRTSDEHRAVLGIGTTSGGMRDTLGLLVTQVTSGGPAEKAGIEEGDRLASVNGTDLRLNAADAQDPEMRGLMARRLVRVVAKLKAGDVATFRVEADGKTREVKVTTVKASDLFKDDGMFRLGALGNGLDALRLERTQEQLDDATARLGALGNQMRDFHFELPSNDGSDIRILTPPDAPDAPAVPDVPDLPNAPDLPDVPDAPAPPASPHFMRIQVPVAPRAPLAPLPGLPPASRAESETI
jgi:membrane-associated protease RseP (regulator of RpoE activity)